jgi:uncharacterized protein HemX
VKALLGIVVAVACVLALGVAVNRSIQASTERQTAERQRYADESAKAAAETKRVNEERGRVATQRAEATAAEQAKAYETIPDIQLLRALTDEDRRAAAAPRPPKH